jgi:S1-C subfamily serine protease
MIRNHRRGKACRAFPRFGTSQGSGFFVTANGHIVTNVHVVKRSSIAEVRLNDGKTYRARVVGVDEASDLALLKVDGRNLMFSLPSSRRMSATGSSRSAIRSDLAER